MAGKKENLKALVSNTRSRIIIVVTAVVLIVSIVVGIVKFSGSNSSSVLSASGLSSSPGGIQSIPGSTDQTAQYAALQQEQNIQQADTAAKTGGSAIPTIIRAQVFGDGVQLIGPKDGNSGVGFEALAREDTVGPQQSLWVQSLKDGDCSKSTINSVLNQGAVITDLKGTCSCIQLKDFGYKLDELLTVCSCKDLKSAGYNARQMKDAGFTTEKLRLCGFDACELRAAGFSAKKMKEGNYSDGELKGAGYPDYEVVPPVGLPPGITANNVLKAGCQLDALIKLKKSGVKASEIRRINGCSAAQLKAAGFTAADLKAAGFSAADLKAAGFTAADLKAAGFTAADLKAAGFTAADLKAAGFSEAQLKAAGYSADVLKQAGFAASDSNLAGLDGQNELENTSVDSSNNTQPGSLASANTKQLQELLSRQQSRMSDQQHQQKIQQRMASMLGAANAALESWRTVSTQANVASTLPGKDKSLLSSGGGALAGGSLADVSNNTQPVLIKAGDVLFAVLDTSVNTDEPGPILATIVSGKYKGSKLIGSFTLPSKADKMVITFNTMSVPGAPRTTAITAYAIDPNTARTALASKANHHYLLRYGSLFASSFMQGIGNAFQSANTTVSIGGTGGITDTTVSNGIGRSVLENAVIGLATVGKDWGAVAKEQFQTPITVLLNAGTGVGILFTQDLTGQDLA